MGVKTLCIFFPFLPTSWEMATHRAADLGLMKAACQWWQFFHISLALPIFIFLGHFNSCLTRLVKNLPVNEGDGKRCAFHPWVRKIFCRRKWQPTPVFLPGKFHGQRSLVGYSTYGCKESDMTEHAEAILYYTDSYLSQEKKTYQKSYRCTLSSSSNLACYYSRIICSNRYSFYMWILQKKLPVRHS